jgi:hypothetical protein
MDTNPYASPQVAYGALPTADESRLTVDAGIVVELERAFQVDVNPHDVAEWATVNDLYAWVLQHCGQAGEGRWRIDDAQLSLAQATLRRTCESLALVLQQDPQQVGPSSSITDWGSWRQKRQNWKKLESTMQVKLPPLYRPKWLVRLLTTLVAGGLAASTWGSILVPAFDGWSVTRSATLAAAIAGCLLLGLAAALLTKGLAINPGPDFETVEGLSRQILADNLQQLYATQRGLAPDDVRLVVNVLLKRYEMDDQGEILPETALEFI